MDYVRKLPVYKEAGVLEYWIVDYDKQVISVYYLQESDEPVKYTFQDTIQTSIYEDLAIDFSQLEEYME